MIAARLFLTVGLASAVFVGPAPAGPAEDCTQAANQDLRISGCTQFIRENPQHQNLALAYTYRGSAYSVRGDTAKALADFGEALKLKPDFYEAVYERSIAFSRMRDYQRALLDTDRAIKINASDWRGHNMRGNANTALSKFDDAIRDYAEAQRLNPKHPWPYLNLCELYIIQNKLDLALARCNESLNISEIPATLRLRGIINIKLRQYDKAISDLDQAARGSGATSANIMYARGVAKRLKGDAAGGDADITAAAQLKPADAAAMFKRYGVPGY